MPECPGCGATLSGPDECERCEYFNLIRNDGRYHYCGELACHCRNLPGLMYMHREVRSQFIKQHQASPAAASAPGMEG